MTDTIRILFLAGVVTLAVALLPASSSTVAQTPCETDDYCHTDLRRPCAGDSCGCYHCHSDKEICCLDDVVVEVPSEPEEPS